MKRRAVSSSCVQSVGYAARSSTLEIKFVNGGVYQYSQVPQDIYQGLMGAQSIGKTFQATVKNRYDYQKQ